MTALAVPTTRAPRSFASCTAAVPTAPAAPWMSSVSPSRGFSISSAKEAVCIPALNPPATSHDISGGFGVTSLTGTTTYSAAARTAVKPRTSVPASSSPSSTTPANSFPGTRGQESASPGGSHPPRTAAS
ncbi:hypothetical protein [Amycolatopsis sp. NPDC051716]|uniref:hypothetical protein n=1 Tax=Amycolatopsis sp. NPDC051716 TaxID=3155804 RepID=UPI00344B0038